MNFSFHFIKIQTKFIHWKESKRKKNIQLFEPKKTSSKQTNKQTTDTINDLNQNKLYSINGKKERKNNKWFSSVCFQKNETKKKQEFSHSTQKQTRNRKREINLILRQEQEKKLFFSILKKIRLIKFIDWIKKERKW